MWETGTEKEMSLVLQRGVPGAFFFGLMVIGWLLERLKKKKFFFFCQTSQYKRQYFHVEIYRILL